MSNLLCSTACGTVPNPPEAYNGCSDYTRRYGSDYFVLISCDYQFTDILDASEWTTAIAAGDIQISPPGKLIIQPPSSTTFEIEGCGREIVGESEYLMDFESYQAKSDLSDYDYYADLNADVRNFRVIPWMCSGEFLVQDDWQAAVAGGSPATVSGTTPGFSFSLSQQPAWVEGEQKKGKWQLQMKVKKDGILRAVDLPGVGAVLGA